MPLSRVTNPFLNVSGAVNANIASPSANTIAFTTATTERMRIDSSGLVGIGTNTPSSYGGGLVVRKSNTGQGVTNATAQFSDAVNSSLWIGHGSGVTNLISEQAITFGKTDGSTTTERMRINAGAPILCLAGGSTTATGTGIAFPATQSASSDANTLDDYEEGTWTPVIVGSSTAGTGTYSVQNGRYTKIGNRVYFGVYCIWSAHTGTGDMTMGGLPFTSSGSNFTGVSIRYSNLTCSAGYICTPIVADNRSDIVFQQSVVGAAATALGQSLDVSADVIMAGHYFIA